MIAASWLIPTILLGLCALVLIACAFGAWLDNERDIAVGIALSVVLFVGVWTLLTWPSFDMDYHTIRPVTGTIAEMHDCGNVDDYLCAIELVGDPAHYQCTDTRCTYPQPGDHGPSCRCGFNGTPEECATSRQLEQETRS